MFWAKITSSLFLMRTFSAGWKLLAYKLTYHLPWNICYECSMTTRTIAIYGKALCIFEYIIHNVTYFILCAWMIIYTNLNIQNPLSMVKKRYWQTNIAFHIVVYLWATNVSIIDIRGRRMTLYSSITRMAHVSVA